MSLEINTAIARACHETERSFLLATFGPTKAGPSWDDLSRDLREGLRVQVLRFRQGEDVLDLPARQVEMFRGTIAVMTTAFETHFQTQ
jgi:hypothetical protein